MIVIDKNGRHVGVYSREWADNKKGEWLSPNVFRMDRISLKAGKPNFRVHIIKSGGIYKITAKDEGVYLSLTADSRQEMRRVVNALNAKRVVIEDKPGKPGKKAVSAANMDAVLKEPPAAEAGSSAAVATMPTCREEVFFDDTGISFFDDTDNPDELEKFLNPESVLGKKEIKAQPLVAEKPKESETLLFKEPDKPEGLEEPEESASQRTRNKISLSALCKKGSAAGIISAVAVPVVASAVSEPVNTVLSGEPEGEGEYIDSVGIDDFSPSEVTEKYRYKFYLDANHYMNFNGSKGAIHPHTWEISVEITQEKKNKIVKFSEIENLIKTVLNPYQMTCLNEVPPFDKVLPATENLGQYFKERIQTVISPEGWNLTELAISESANRSYVL